MADVVPAVIDDLVFLADSRLAAACGRGPREAREADVVSGARRGGLRAKAGVTGLDG